VGKLQGHCACERALCATTIRSAARRQLDLPLRGRPGRVCQPVINGHGCAGSADEADTYEWQNAGGRGGGEQHESSHRAGVGHRAHADSDETAPRLADASGFPLRRCGRRMWSRSCGATSKAFWKPRWCWRCCASAIPSNFSRGRRGHYNDGFGTGGHATASSHNIRLARNGPMDNPLTVNIATSGTATSGVDYQALPSSVCLMWRRACCSSPWWCMRMGSPRIRKR
jgi:hypothetical protein